MELTMGLLVDSSIYNFVPHYCLKHIGFYESLGETIQSIKKECFHSDSEQGYYIEIHTVNFYLSALENALNALIDKCLNLEGVNNGTNIRSFMYLSNNTHIYLVLFRDKYNKFPYDYRVISPYSQSFH